MTHCRRFVAPPISRREMLSECALGFGAIALQAMLAGSTRGDAESTADPWLAKPSQFPAAARHVIFLYMDGGPSHVDTFDYKPALKAQHGKDPVQVLGRVEPTQFNSVGKVLMSPWKFQQHGSAGAWISELLPHLAGQADKLCFVKSMVSNFSEHTAANYFLHSGTGVSGRPSMGAWIGYGLGSESEELPGFIVLNGGLIPPGGVECFGSGFLPAAYQASIFQPGPEAVANIARREPTAPLQRHKLDLIRDLDDEWRSAVGVEPTIDTAIANYEKAYRMQTAVPGLLDFADETPATRRMYGLEADYPNTRVYGRQCLIARRLVERGVRFIELTCPSGNGDRWDQHGNLVDGHQRNALTVDQPIAALLQDLDQRGLLPSTLVVWAGEFGRTPFAQGEDGRDHNPYGFTVWFAGGGVRPGFSYGQTDEWGYRAIQDRTEVHDLHATMLHLLGLDHTKVTYRSSSRDMRLTDVHGRVLHEILA